jgi:hypothetical protein
VNIADFGPCQKFETPDSELLAKKVFHFPMDKVHLIIGYEKERQVKDPDHGKDLAETDAGKGCALELPDPDLSQNIHFIAGHAPRIDPETDLPFAFSPDGSIKLLHTIHPGGPFRGDGGKLDDEGLAAPGLRRDHHEQSKGEKKKKLAQGFSPK